MTRPLRLTNPEYVHLVTLRTRQARLFLTPTPKCREIIGGIVARYQERHDIRIHNYKFLGNHYHLVVSAPHGNLWQFEQEINREISKRIGWELDYEGGIWARRYDDQIAVEEEDALEALLYVTLNDVHHGLTYHPRDWPGLNAYEQLRDGKPRQFTFVNFSDYTKAKLRNRKADIRDFTPVHSLTLTPLPSLRVSSVEEQWKIIEPLINRRLNELRKKNNLNPNSFRGANYARQNPLSCPNTIARTPRPSCYTKSFTAKQIFKSLYTSVSQTYKEISKVFRSGDYTVLFPPNTLKPPLHYVPQ